MMIFETKMPTLSGLLCLRNYQTLFKEVSFSCCRKQWKIFRQVLFSYNTIKRLGKNPSKPDTSRQNPESSCTHTIADTVGILKKYSGAHFISFLLFFFQNNLRQTMCTVQYRKFDTFGNHALPQNAQFHSWKTRGNYEFTTFYAVRMYCWRRWMKFY